MKISAWFLIAIFSLLSMAVLGQQVHHFAIMSPGCSKQEIKDMAGKSLLSISERKEWKEVQGYNVTLSGNPSVKTKLIGNMMKAKCFVKKR